MSAAPARNIINAFGPDKNSELFEGGQGEAYRAGDIVLKSVLDKKETIWCIEILNNFQSEKVRVTKPIKAKNGDWIFNGWMAYEYLEGKSVPDDLENIYQVSKDFHKVLKNIPRPDFFDDRMDPWAIADRMAWNELPLPLEFDQAREALERLDQAKEKIDLDNQIIHGDIGGNVLFHKTLPPAVIDFSPYWRPTNFAFAIAIVDALTWQGAREKIIKIFKDIEELDQLIIRAFIRRICETINLSELQKRDCAEDMKKHLQAADKILGRLQIK